jgi:PhnB protein
MSLINTYLTFPGNCRTAMEFYQSCLGGELTFQTIGETPLAAQMPKEMQDRILHATLANGELILMGSDMVPDGGLRRGNAVSLSLNCKSEEEIRSCYQRLAEGGNAEHPIEETFWGALFGDLTDKFGNHWILHFEQP